MVEVRFGQIEVECRDDGAYKIGGYVNATERESELLYSPKRGKWFNEVVKQGAFTRSLNSGKEIPLLLEHDETRRLADNVAGTLTLKEDQIGLRFDAEIRDKDVYEKVKNKTINNCSFGFRPIDQEFESVSEVREKRYLKDLELLEVSLVENPAYAGSLVEVRNMNEQMELLEEQRAKEKEKEDKSKEDKKEDIPEDKPEEKEETPKEDAKEDKKDESKEKEDKSNKEDKAKKEDKKEKSNEERGYVDDAVNNLNNSLDNKEVINEIIKEKEEHLKCAENYEGWVKEDVECIKKENEEREFYANQEAIRASNEVLKLRVQILKLKSI